MATWSRKTYSLVAAIIKEQYRFQDNVTIWQLMAAFELEFALDNPRFEVDKFRQACLSK